MVAKHRKNFLPTFIINIIFWLSWFYVVFKIPPDLNFQFSIFKFQVLLPLGFMYFFSTLTFALSLTFAFLFSNTRRGFFLSLFVCGILLLRLAKQAHFLNLILLGGILGCLEIYFSKTH
jgi:small-conductance mechanosensitive channel